MGSVMVKHFPTTKDRPARLSYWCSACDYQWTEKPLYAKESGRLYTEKKDT